MRTQQARAAFVHGMKSHASANESQRGKKKIGEGKECIHDVQKYCVPRVCTRLSEAREMQDNNYFFMP